MLLLAVVAYLPTLNDWFGGDDFWFLHSGQQFSFWDYALKSLDFRETGSLPEFDRYRPLYPIAWHAQYQLFGLNAAGYYFVVLLLHVANTALVWFIARKLTNLDWAAAVAAAVFALHPGYVDAVGWLSGANRAFALLPSLVSFVCFIQFWEGTTRLRWAWFVGSVLAFVAAVLFHSAAITLALVLPAYAFLIRPTPGAPWKPGAWRPFVPFAAVAVSLLAIQFWVRSHLEIAGQFEFGWHQYAAYGIYFGRALFPVFPVEGVSSGAYDALEAIEGFASFAMVVLCVALIAQRRYRAIGIFAVTWLVLALFPDSTLRFSTAGRMLYLAGPAIGLIIAVAAMSAYSLLPEGWTRPANQLAPFAAALIVVPLVLLTLHHIDLESRDDTQNRQFAEQLRASVDEVPDGGILYVAGAPGNLVVFDTSRLRALVELYYGPTEVRGGRRVPAFGPPASVPRNDRIFEFQP